MKSKEKYNTAFLEKIAESKEQAKNGKVMRVEKNNLKDFLNL